MFKNLFKMNKTRDILTVFHSPKSAASNSVLSMLRSANSAAEASPEKKVLFDLDIVEGPMTQSQLKTILEYVGGDKNVGQVVKGASGVVEAIKLLESGEDAVARPITVDWNNGRAVIGDNQPALKQLIDALPKD